MADLLVARLVAPNPGPMTGPGTNTFVVGDGQGGVVIDPGAADPAHLRAVAAAGASRGGIRAIVITHGHRDHRGGAAELAALVGAPVLALRPGATGVPEATAALADGERITAGAQSLTVVATPGHRFDHLGLWHAASGTFFAGDLLTGFGTVVIMPPEGDMRAYLASLARVQALAPRHIWPAHGAALDDPAARLADLITHRLAREARVLAAVRAAPGTTLDALLPTVYVETDPTLWRWARGSLLAHLIKLAADGQVVRDDPTVDQGPWRPA